MDKGLKKDVLEWDIENWSRAVGFWESLGQLEDIKGKEVLDIGGKNGGISLYWSLKGAHVVCSDIDEKNFTKARQLHQKYGVDKQIKYEIVDALNMSYENEFDIISFKSVLGGIGRDDNFENQKQMMKNIHKALKTDGFCYYVENLKASGLHQFLRKRLTAWGSSWRYIDLSEIMELGEGFCEIYYKTFGFLGVFGKGGGMGKCDKLIDRYVMDKHKYIVSCILKK